MALKKYIAGQGIKSAENNGNEAEILRAVGLNMIRQAKDGAVDLPADGGQFVEAYVNSTGQQNSVDTGATDMAYNSGNDLYYADGTGNDLIEHTLYTTPLSSTVSSAFLTTFQRGRITASAIQYKLLTAEFSAINANSFIEIEATSIDKTQLEINDCLVIPKDEYTWILGNTDADDELARAKIYKTLFYGTTGGDPRVTSGIVGLTVLKTSITRDVGKRAFYIRTSSGTSSDSGQYTRYTGTFADTSTNADASFWLEGNFDDDGISANDTYRIEAPSGTTLQSEAGSQGSSFSNIGTDESATETSNPATCQQEAVVGRSSRNVDIRTLILASGDISFTGTSNFGGSSPTFSETDFNADHSVPDLTSGASISITSEDSGWLASNEKAKFTAFTTAPTRLQVRNTETGDTNTGIEGVYLHGTQPD